MTKMVNIKCSYCGKESEKRLAEINRQKKKGKNQFYCGLSCSGKSDTNLKKLTKYRKPFAKNHLYANNRKDEFTPFRYHLRNAKNHSGNREFSITLDDLKDLWNQQNGVCAVTGLELVIKAFDDNQSKSPFQASLDRIDNSKGYTKNNIRFVCLMFNYARNNFTDAETLEFFKKAIGSTPL
jgi:hypothetical protein